MSYFELHARSAFSFLQAASFPEELAETASALEIPGVAIADIANVSGIVRFYKEARLQGIAPFIGAEIPVWDDSSLTFLVQNNDGYKNLCSLISNIKLRGDIPATAEELRAHAKGLICLTGGGEGVLFRNPKRAKENLRELTNIFGRENLYVELQRHLQREQETINQHLIETARSLQIPLVATNGVAYHSHEKRNLYDALTCLNNHTTLRKAGKLLAANSERCFKSPREMLYLFRDLPEAIFNTREIAARLNFDLKADLGYRFPDFKAPHGHDANSFLRQCTYAGARNRYRVFTVRVREQLEKELGVIEKLGLAGYFLIVWDICQFCKANGILTQGRGSAANSAVCYSLGITAVDPIKMDLLFERFLTEERNEYPDIDLDLPSGDEREKVIQYVYQTYGTRGAGMTCVNITYQRKLAVREIGKVLEIPETNLAKLSRLIATLAEEDRKEPLSQKVADANLNLNEKTVGHFLNLVAQAQQLPRHLSQHPGGMIICAGDLGGIVPLQPAAMPNRVMIQWDKDDCADMGLIKVDLLGLGMMAAMRETFNLVSKHYQEDIDLAQIPPDDKKVYEALQKADTVGWFQVESRAQMSSLPRTRPACFYDIVVQVAIIRPGPIAGQMANPYIRRRQGLEPPTCLHPALEPALRRTLGVPLFQEQLLRIAMILADFTGGEAEQLRRALGSKRSKKAMNEIEKKLRRGMTAHGISNKQQDVITKAITSFALYGFPESHAASFALLSYASGYLKCHYLAAYTAALLNNQPMGFYAPAVLVKDAERHGLNFFPVDANKSDSICTLETNSTGALCVRLGFNYIKGLSSKTIEQILVARIEGEFTSIADFKRRVPIINQREFTQLARAGVFDELHNARKIDRRDALWAVALESRTMPPLYSDVTEISEFESPLAAMNEMDKLVADLSVTSLTLADHPIKMIRKYAHINDVTFCGNVDRLRNNSFVKLVGCVICRQRPQTARGLLFLSLEDETGIVNVIVMPDIDERHRLTIADNSYLIVKGIVQKQGDAVSVKALFIAPLQNEMPRNISHDYR